MSNFKNYTNDVVYQEEKNGIQYLKFRILDEYEYKFKCFMTLKHGGFSTINNETNLLSFKGLDIPENMRNVEKVKETFNISHIYKAKQAHTNNILTLGDSVQDEKYKIENLNEEEFDAYITDKKNIATVVTTADCNPIVMYDKVNNVYASVHSGWKGTANRIYIKTVCMLRQKYGTNMKDLIVCIGPSIKQCCFDSEDEIFRKYFVGVNQEDKNFLYYEENSNRFHINLEHMIINDLVTIGVPRENIVSSRICTCCNSDDFFSYRKSTKEGKDDYGLMGTFTELI